MGGEMMALEANWAATRSTGRTMYFAASDQPTGGAPSTSGNSQAVPLPARSHTQHVRLDPGQLLDMLTHLTWFSTSCTPAIPFFLDEENESSTCASQAAIARQGIHVEHAIGSVKRPCLRAERPARWARRARVSSRSPPRAAPPRPRWRESGTGPRRWGSSPAWAGSLRLPMSAVKSKPLCLSSCHRCIGTTTVTPYRSDRGNSGLLVVALKPSFLYEKLNENMSNIQQFLVLKEGS